MAGNTAGYGNLADGAHPSWVGDFTGSGKTEVLFNYVGDGNWWLGTFTGRRIAGLGLDPATFSGHSVRAGFLTRAAESGASIWKLSEVSRHKSLDTLRGYVRRVDLFKEHAGAAFL